MKGQMFVQFVILDP